VVHIEDIARAFLAVLHAPLDAVHNQAFNIGRDTDNYQIREIAAMVEAEVPGSRVEYAEDGGPDRRCYRVDFSKATRLLPRFQPRWTVREGIRELHEAYRDVGLRLEDLEGSRYLRIKHIKRLQALGRLDANLRWRDSIPAAAASGGDVE
jgi:hypothetical protein